MCGNISQVELQLYRQVSTTVHSKTVMLLSLYFSQKQHSTNTVGQDSEFWMTYVGTWHFEEQ